jgi:hypothetical protein
VQCRSAKHRSRKLICYGNQGKYIAVEGFIYDTLMQELRNVPHKSTSNSLLANTGIKGFEVGVLEEICLART